MNNQYYNTNAQIFYDSTINVEMSALYKKFLPLIPTQGYILDAGCGSGRDTLAFIQQGFYVEAFDASEVLVKLARDLTKQNIRHDTFLTFTTPTLFNAIWACASLLHVPTNSLTQTFAHLAQMLKPNAVFYCSFKYGDNEVIRNGRRFTNLNADLLKYYLKDTQLKIKETWISQDLRPKREQEKWLNAILIKEAL